MFSRNRLIVPVLLLALLLLPVAGAAAQESATPTDSLTVDGVGSVSAAPDMAHLRLGVALSGTDVTTVFDDVNTTVSDVINALVEAGIAREDLQTSGISIFQDQPFNQPGQPSAEAQFRVSNTLSVTLRDVSRVGELISLAVEAGANRVDSLEFGIADPTPLEDAAREEAVAQARDRAQKLADVLGVTLGDPIIVTETSGPVGGPFPGAGMAMEQAQAAPVEQGQISVQVRVRITFRLG
jgi:hypothetical protein